MQVSIYIATSILIAAKIQFSLCSTLNMPSVVKRRRKDMTCSFITLFFLGSILRLLEIPFGCQDATARLNNTKPNKNTPDGSREDEKWFNREKEHGENGKRIPLVSPTYQVISVLLQILTAEKPHKTRGGRSGDTQRDYCSSDQTDELQLKGHRSRCY